MSDVPLPTTHTAIATTSKGRVEAIEAPTESPGDGEVLIKVEYAAMAPFDVYFADRGFYVDKYPLTLGFNGAGTIARVGAGVSDLAVGDKVIALGYGASRSRSLQEYCTLEANVVAKIPDNLPLADAATIPDHFVTAFYMLFNQLGLPVPSSLPVIEPPPRAMAPILIYGAGSTTGLYAVQLLRLAGYMKIIATASQKHHDYLHSLGATDTFDYKSSSLVEDVNKTAGGAHAIMLAADCITAESTLKIVAKLVNSLAKVALLLPVKEGDSVTNDEDQHMYTELPSEKNPFAKTTTLIGVRTFSFRQDEYLNNNLIPKILPALLRSGYIMPNRVRLLDQGTLGERVANGLSLIRENKVSGEKVVVKIA